MSVSLMKRVRSKAIIEEMCKRLGIPSEIYFEDKRGAHWVNQDNSRLYLVSYRYGDPEILMTLDEVAKLTKKRPKYIYGQVSMNETFGVKHPRPYYGPKDRVVISKTDLRFSDAPSRTADEVLEMYKSNGY